MEDDLAVRSLLIEYLTRGGFATITATDGGEAIELMNRRAPTLVLTDLEMAGMEGFGLLAEVRRDPRLRTVPVVVITGRSGRSSMRRAMELGAADFIYKPFREEEVLRAIETQREKRELLDEIRAFAHTVAHDLKNPLTTLVGRIDFANTLLERGKFDALGANLQEASRSAFRLSRIIDELLLLAGVRDNTVTIDSVDMGATVADAIDRLEDLLRRTGARVTQPTVWPAAAGYAPWIAEIWTNYLSNAAKYGGERPAIRIGSDRAEKAGFVRYWVKDSGPGIDEAASRRLFAPFTRLEEHRATGHGLGLSIVRRIVDKLGGQAGFANSAEGGACFWFELPAAATDRPAAAAAAS